MVLCGSKLSWFFYEGRKSLDCSVGMEIDFIVVWVAEIDLISVWGIELDLISVLGIELDLIPV